MPNRQYRHQWVLTQHFLIDSRVVEMNSAKANIDAAALERLDLLQRGHLLQPQFQVCIAPKFSNQFRQHGIQR
ncbi:hypothetical protein D3C80_2098090 [compost metagenome]